jgi:hypothetical protein
MGKWRDPSESDYDLPSSPSKPVAPPLHAAGGRGTATIGQSIRTGIPWTVLGAVVALSLQRLSGVSVVGNHPGKSTLGDTSWQRSTELRQIVAETRRFEGLLGRQSILLDSLVRLHRPETDSSDVNPDSVEAGSSTISIDSAGG